MLKIIVSVVLISTLIVGLGLGIYYGVKFVGWLIDTLIKLAFPQGW